MAAPRKVQLIIKDLNQLRTTIKDDRTMTAVQAQNYNQTLPQELDARLKQILPILINPDSVSVGYVPTNESIEAILYLLYLEHSGR